MAPVPATAAAGSSTREIRRAQRADGPAAVLAIGTANPEKCVTQDEYADFYFRITNSDHLPELKDKLSRICNKSGIEKRFMYVSDELMEAHPEFADRHLPSLDARVEIASKNVPELAAAASAKAIAEWGRPATDITHLIFSTYSGVKAPSGDRLLASLLGLRPTVSRTVLSLHGCYGGGRALQLAKELAENNRGARVLVACAESTLIAFYGPEVGCNDIIVGQALFGDGSGAVIVGADPVDAVERPLFEMAFASQTTIPDSEGAITMQYMKGGMDYHIASGVPEMLAGNVERCLAHAFDSVGVAAKWKDLFWAVHPGGRRILDLIEEALGLENGAMAASRQVLSEFGNMSGTTVIFVLNELRRRFEADGAEGADWGALMAFGPGVTVETVLLRVASGLKPNQ
ncbi:bisdemethoxycurcumin synthase-like [Oryza brachyantha]|uniref:Chalcone synthase n=1 Tax=Oryza brachyantha TaxID=4533 RepID=J3ML43_ORYBR|nr:bisdemethoxycurcumin synthase-like [Oryza brachyantha]